MKFQRSSMDVGVAPDLEITQGPEGSLGSERWALNPEVSGFLEYGLLESGDCFHDPEAA